MAVGIADLNRTFPKWMTYCRSYRRCRVCSVYHECFLLFLLLLSLLLLLVDTGFYCDYDDDFDHCLFIAVVIHIRFVTTIIIIAPTILD